MRQWGCVYGVTVLAVEIGGGGQVKGFGGGGQDEINERQRDGHWRDIVLVLLTNIYCIAPPIVLLPLARLSHLQVE